MNIIEKCVCHRLIIGSSVLLLLNYSIVGLFASDIVGGTTTTTTSTTTTSSPIQPAADSNRTLVSDDSVNYGCCGNSSQQKHQPHRIEIEYETNIVQNEYIVRFRNYCLPHVREKYINDALAGTKVMIIIIKSQLRPEKRFISKFVIISGPKMAHFTAQ